MTDQIGFLHPGEMGSALAGIALENGHPVWWASQGRSAATRARAANLGLEDAVSLAGLCRQCTIIIAICPPDAALAMARQVADHGFHGLYLDANAISPDHARDIQNIVEARGGRFVDGAIIGPPPVAAPAKTQLVLAGTHLESVTRILSSERLTIANLGGEIGKASALKICHSAMHKGQLALLFATLSAAERLGVRGELEKLFLMRPATAGYVQGQAEDVRRAAKGWRFAGEMTEIAETFSSAGLPPEFHEAARDIFSRLPGPDKTMAVDSVPRVIAAVLAGNRNPLQP